MEEDRAPDAKPASVAPKLSDRDLAILAFEAQWSEHVGAKEQAIRAEFSLSAARYYQLLGALIDSPLALAHDPMLIKRLQRMRDARSVARARRSIHTPDYTRSNDLPNKDRTD
ncbi:DUF3263 domain-containing protein [Leifsonia kafniensis]|uniref:DUF3263 domain-containing protein n=1 Tax=Leifsonia kafniensis TaxID=475957 RepID=A0ABP7L0I2_9MICO